MLLTKRLILRNWKETDAKDLYFLASNVKISKFCGFKRHSSEKESLFVIKNILNKAYNFAVLKREDETLIGCVSFKDFSESFLAKSADEAEVGYWIGEKFWMRGYAFEALKKLIEFGFSKLKLKKIWASVSEENFKSFNLLKKLGFCYFSSKDIYFKAIDEKVFSKILFLNCERWVYGN